MPLTNTIPSLTTSPSELTPVDSIAPSSNSSPVACESNAAVFVSGRECNLEVPQPIDDMEYATKQYGTDALISGGAIAAGVLIFAPEPIATKILGGSIALSCIAAGAFAKHNNYRDSYAHKALSGALLKLRNEVDSLNTEINILKATGKGLENTNQELQLTKSALEVQAAELRFQTQKLEGRVAKAFEQLSKDRDAFGREKRAKLAQLNHEIAEADSHEIRAQERLETLEARSIELKTVARELDARRKALVTAETELREMQSKILDFAVANPESFSFRPESLEHVSPSVSEAVNRAFPPEADLYFQQLKTLAMLPRYKGAKLRVENDGCFILQKKGVFSQSIPRTFATSESVRSRQNFFRPVFNLFNQSVSYFDNSELQQAFNGLQSMWGTYAHEPAKRKKLEDLIGVILADNPTLQEQK
ncbi:MAG: hypothetical protein VYA34_02905 [Myxococcota bacterium]|nr:hypothetical protein [Myxococcota bacterium]